jgi:PIN domain nuclease of toxin-antitoxin system
VSRPGEPAGGAVLDASALLALIRGEPGADSVEAILGASVMSAVNWSEVRQRLLAHGIDDEALLGDVEALGIEMVAFDAEDAERAASLWPTTRDAGLSLGDRACLALAQRLDRPAVTADRVWTTLGLGIEVVAIR